MGARAALRAQDYRWERISQRVLGYYERLLEEKRPRKQDAEPNLVGA
jgi:hypothetical protein